MRLAMRVFCLVLVALVLAGGTAIPTFGQDAVPVPAATLRERVDVAVAAAGARIGSDPAALVDAVRSGVVAERYSGSLKGARGTFLTNAANDVDQALLLAALAAGADPSVQLRFASCELPLEGSSTASSGIFPERAPFDEEQADRLALSTPDLELAAAILDVADLRSRSLEQATAGAAELAAALAGSSAWSVPASITAASPATHTWLQVDQAGAWVDLDPSTSTGTAPCTATATTDELPASQQQRVRLSLVVERLVGGLPVTSEVLSVERAIADVAASPIIFGFGEPLGLIDRPAGLDMPGVPYTPVLRIDDETVIGESFVLPRLSGSIGETVGDLLGGVEDTLGQLGGPAQTPSPEGEDPVSGAWLRIEFQSPSVEPVVLQSEVFDRIGMAARAAGTAGWQPQPLDEVDGEYAALGAIWQIGLLLGEMQAPEVAGGSPQGASAVDDISAQLDGLLRIYPALQHDLGGRFSPPGVLLGGLVPTLGADDQPGTTLVLDALLVPSVPPRSVEEAALDGWATLAAERMLAASINLGPSDGSSSSHVFDAAKAAGIPLMVLAPGDAVRLSGAHDRAIARIVAHLATGARVVVPTAAPLINGDAKLAWWLMDPVSGLLRDEHENGRHAESAEYAGQLPRVTSTGERFRRFFCRVRTPLAVAITAVYLLTGASGAGPGFGASPLHEPLEAVVESIEAEAESRKAREAAQQAACAGTGTGSG